MDEELPPDPAMDQGGEAASTDHDEAPVKDPLDDEEFASAVKQLAMAARAHMDDKISADARRAWRYYNGEVDATPAFELLDDNKESFYEGSAVVIRTCADQVRMMLPEIARVFLSSDEAVAYTPASKGDEDYCEQATDWANYVWKVMNDGENLLLDGVIDWAVKFAALKVYWKVDKRRTRHDFNGISQMAMMQLQQEAHAKHDVKLTANPREILLPQMVQGPDGQPMQQMVPDHVFDGYLEEVSEDRSQICIELVAQDEFLIDPFSQSRQEPMFIGSDCRRSVSDVVAMGIPLDVVLAHKGASSGPNSQDGWGRKQRQDGWQQHLTGDVALDDVRIVEAVVQLDRDGDGITERYRVTCLGDDYTLVEAKETDDCGYIVGSPYRIPHEPIGMGIVEDGTDLQDIQTSLVRDSLNNFRRANHPREIVSSSDTDAYQDIKSIYGGPIRAEDPTKIGFHVIPYVGNQAFQYIQYFEGIGARRTGISDASAGLDADILKGQTAETGHAIVTGPQARMEYLIREFALGIMRPLFKEILRLSVKYQDKARTIRLRNKWVDVDPRSWNAEMDAVPRVGLGTGTRNERLQGLMTIMLKQEQLKAVGDPFYDPEGYRQSLSELCELTGRKDDSRYFKEMTAEELQAAVKAQQDAAKQSAMEQAQMQAQVEGAKAEGQAKVKAQADIQKAHIDSAVVMQQATLASDQAAAAHLADIQWQREAKVMDLQIQREKLAQEERLKMYELEQEARLKAMMINAKVDQQNANIKQQAN